MKTYFIAPLEATQTFRHPDDGAVLWKYHHAIPVDENDPTGLQLVVIAFPDEGGEGVCEMWLKHHHDIQPLPHPMNIGKAISADHHKLLSTRFGAEPTDSVWHIADKAGKIAPDFRLTAFL